MQAKQVKIGPPLRAWQRDCIRSMTRFTVLVIHRRAGKTELALLRLIDSWMKAETDNALFGYVCPLRVQAKRVVWRRLKTLLQPMIDCGMAKVGETDLTIDLLSSPYRPRIQLFGSDNADAIRGSHFDGVIVDEVANIKRDAWEMVLRPTVSDRDKEGWCIFIGTPSGQNLFYDLWKYAQDETQPEWSGRRYTVYETDAISPKEIENLKATMSSEAFAQEFLCDWDIASANQFISLSLVSEALRRSYSEKDLRGMPLILGVDVARYGDDSTVFYPRRGFQALQPTRFRGLDNMAVAGRVANYIQEERPDAVFIDGGGGAGVIDRLRQLGFMQVIEVQFGSRAHDDNRYKNWRAEMWAKMKEWLELGGALQSGDIVDELCTPMYEIDPVGRLKLEAKHDVKQRLKHSPDLADALALTFAEPVFNSKEYGYKPIRTDYNPLERYDMEQAGNADY